jgi:hypothetical protein
MTRFAVGRSSFVLSLIAAIMLTACNEKIASKPGKTIGEYRPKEGKFYLRNTNAAGDADITFSFGPSGQNLIPVAGDWDGDGKDSVGLYDPANGGWFLKNSNSDGIADTMFSFGPSAQNLLPVAGDWDGDGRVGVGLFDPRMGNWSLKNSNSNGVADMTFTLGFTDAKPIIGRWK